MLFSSQISVLGVIGADCHSVGNKILDVFFTEAGFHVVNLGVLVSQDAFIDAASELNARAILVSSLYGHAEIDCGGLRARCIEAVADWREVSITSWSGAGWPWRNASG